MTSKKQFSCPRWKDVDPQDIGDAYCFWVNELTAQGLHSKSDIALVLAIMSEQLADAKDDATRLHKAFMDAKYPETAQVETSCVGSGDPANCPENEGRGCCQPSPASTENIAVWIDNDDNVQWDYELNCDHPSHAVIVRAKRAFKSVCAHGCYPGREICMCRASVGQECCFTVKTSTEPGA